MGHVPIGSSALHTRLELVGKRTRLTSVPLTRSTLLACALLLVSACGADSATATPFPPTGVIPTTATVPSTPVPPLDSQTSPSNLVTTTTECTAMDHVQMTGAVVDFPSLEAIGTLGAALAVVRTSPDGSFVVADENRSVDRPQGSAGSGPLPFVVTRSTVTIEQLVIWPDSVPVPDVGDEVSLDVDGGTLGCFWFDVFEATSLQPNAEYLVIAGVAAGGRWILGGGNMAYSVANGWITSSKANASTAIKLLLGTEVSSLPPLTIVPSSI